MLKIQLNKKDAIPTYRLIERESGFTATLNEKGNILLSGIKTGGMSIGDKIKLVRYGCNGNPVFIDSVSIIDVLKDSVVIEQLPDIVLDGAIKKTGVKATPNENSFNALEINGIHCFLDNPEGCKVKIKENIIDDYSEYDKKLRRCKGDYVLYDSCYLYQATGISQDNKYLIDSNFKNKTVSIKMINASLAEEYAGRGDGVDWEADSEKGIIWLKNCVVPVNFDGSNDLHHLIWKGTIFAGVVNKALPNIDGIYTDGITTFACENEKYYIISGSEVIFFDTAELYFEESCIKISGSFEEHFDVNLFQKNALEKKFFFEKNKIIDFEKQIFYPVYIENNVLKDVSNITYNTYFRERTNVKQPDINDSSSVEAYEEGRKKWKINESGGWNITAVTEDNNGDLAGYLGFDDDDIYYQKKKVGMSFLRLSLYDNKDRLTQSLLGYSTMFLDSTTLYKKYVYKKNSQTPNEEINKYVVFRTDEPQLGVNFSCGNKYNSDKSSEGFYLYLFPSLLETQPIDNEGWSSIYMKVEFNNAKYGKTVPFIKVDNGMPKNNYVIEDSANTENSYIDMNSLFSDMYIEIKIKFDEDSKRYVWRFNDKNSSNIVINLFEPKVNK